jgi:hypothetical protein
MDLKQAIQRIKKNSTDPYVAEYINAIPDVIEEDGTQGLLVQLEYILSNLSKWKGLEAKETKDFIRQWVKNKRKLLKSGQK